MGVMTTVTTKTSKSIAFKPTASLEALAQRAELLASLRGYFRSQRVMEVDIPVLAEHSVTDVHLAALSVTVHGETQYLQTSPEYYLKRLLAAGSGPIYSLGKAFRADDHGTRHRTEFTMLEWYRLGFDDGELRQDVKRLLRNVGVKQAVQEISYSELFMAKTGLNPHVCSDRELADYCLRHFAADWPNTPRSTWLDLIFSSHIEPYLNDPILVYDFPACQCALAKLATNGQGESVAKRFELYWQGIELANGYWELTDVAEQKRRFEYDNQQRQEQGQEPMAIDPYFVAALESGLPECSGIALGVDRLLMCLLKTKNIADVVAFA